MPTLTPAQLAFFHENGYLKLTAAEHNLVSPAQLQQWTNEVRSWPLEKGKWMPYFEVTSDGTRQLMRTENFVDFHEPFRDLVCGDGLGGVLGQLAGEKTTLFKDKINYKLPNGNGFHAHVDYHAYSHIAPLAHLTANIAVDDATVANGCLEIVPGSHRMEIAFEQGGRIARGWEDAHEWVPVELCRGDVLFFGSMLAHRSKRNESVAGRSSVYVTFVGRGEGEGEGKGEGLRRRYYEHRRRAFPPDHERDAEVDYAQGWKQYGFAAPFSPTDAVDAVPTVKA
ncbi:phytanoyl-CoA dioxygenase family protein [Aspergillus candidus]|uniref:Epoxidase subunit A n=1 Tax=Aspergillus candidus TaxID=41067 RepID=A0A2I2FCL4_ASPCN|nr:epoxidase subunit A [Aspergillus candidus]PLB38352.1 epoxidase subunit A [Aspergillus candidus]